MTVNYEPLCFVDTNVFVYAISVDEVVRSKRAHELIHTLMVTGALCSSTQVLQEFYSAATRKIRKRITPLQAVEFLEQIATFPVYAHDYGSIREAIGLSLSDQVSFWDALIIVAAIRSRAQVLYTEDLQHGRVIGGVRIVNPFR